MGIRKVAISAVILSLVPIMSGCSCETDVVRIGEPAPTFELESLTGEVVSLEDLRGSGVLLNFWATGCVPCQQEMPYLQELYEELEESSTSVVLLTINMSEDPLVIADFMRYFKLSLPVLLDSKLAVSGQYDIQFIPTTFFIDKDGVIQDKVLGGFPNKEAIEIRLEKIIP